MKNQCRSCLAPSDLFLCGRCVSELRGILTDLPWWVERLAEEAVGDVRKSDGAKGSVRRQPFKGDDQALTLCRCGHPEHENVACREVDRDVMLSAIEGPVVVERTCDCDDYAPVIPQARLRSQLLAAGRVNARASKLLDEVRNTLTTMARHLGESRGIRFVRPSFIGPLLSGDVRLGTGTPALIAFLSTHVQAIACDEGAGEDLRSLVKHQRAIERIVDLPVYQRFAGPCPTLVVDKTTKRQRECGTRLMAPQESIRVRCPVCKSEHDIERIINRLLANVDHWRFTREELIGSSRGDWQGIMGLLDEPVTRQTFHRWCKEGMLKPHGYRRPDGSNGIARHSEADEPLYRLSKVRGLRTEMATKQVQAMGWAR